MDYKTTTKLVCLSAIYADTVVCDYYELWCF